MEKLDALWLWWIVGTLAVICLAMVHRMSFDDAVAEQALYCEMAADGTWPVNHEVCP